MHGLAALAAYVEAQHRGQLDWAAFLHVVAGGYHGKTALVLHHFGAKQSGRFFQAANFDPEYIEKFQQYADRNPWLPFAWSFQTGTLIHGSVLNPIDRTAADFKEFYENWMVPQNVVRGLGAVLLKDRDVNPDWVVFIAILRPDGEKGVGLYSDDEVESFKALIPFMVRHIRDHPTIQGLLAGRSRREGYDGSLSGSVRHFGDAPSGVGAIGTSLDDFLAGVGIVDAGLRQLAVRVIEAARDEDEALLSRIRDAIGAVSGAPVRLPATPPVDKQTGKPQFYSDRPKCKETNRREDIVQFLDRVWFDPWIKAGVLTRVDLTRLDGQAAQALQHYLRAHELPPHLHSLLRRKGPPREEATPEAIRAARRLLRREYRERVASRQSRS